MSVCVGGLGGKNEIQSIRLRLHEATAVASTFKRLSCCERVGGETGCLEFCMSCSGSMS